MKKLALLATSVLLGFTLKAQMPGAQTAPVIKNRILKVDFFSPLTGNLTFGYEQPLVNSVTFTGELGIIGASLIDLANNEAGIFLKGGPRFYFSPDYLMDGMKRYNDFQGAYFNPEIIYSGFGFDYLSYNQTTNQTTNSRGTNHSVALMLQFGKQWVLAKTLSIDLYGGMGYGWSAVKADNYASGYGFLGDLNELAWNKFSHFQFSNSVPVAINAGFNIGFLLK